VSGVVDQAIAESGLTELVRRLGQAFHPDTPVADYVTADPEVGAPFTPIEVTHYQAVLDLAHEVYGDDIYLVATRLMGLEEN
jgi:hypothetical protein